MIEVNGRQATVTKVWNEYAWRLQFYDNQEIVNVFYWQEEKFKLIRSIIF